MERAVWEGIWIDQAIEGLVQRARDFGGAPGARALEQALGPLLRKALHPCAAGGIGHRARRGDGVDLVTGHDLPDSLGTAQAPRRFGLLAQGI